ncbi:MAG: Gldg family protein, partial [Magnetococcales bacterium]|nr:Gldg family protein [Magnetococcales bacterium]
MKMDSGSRMNLRMQNFVTGLLIVVLLGGVAFATHRYQVRWDWTTSSRHTLAEQSVKAIKQFEELVATVYVQEKSDQRNQAQDLLDKYRVENPKLTIRYLDPDIDPSAAKKDEVALYGTVVLRSGEKREKVTELTEEKLTNALVRLAKGGEKSIAFITGHGEHPIQDASAAAQHGPQDGSER